MIGKESRRESDMHETVICPSCGTTHPESRRECPNCGAILPEPVRGVKSGSSWIGGGLIVALSGLIISSLLSSLLTFVRDYLISSHPLDLALALSNDLEMVFIIAAFLLFIAWILLAHRDLNRVFTDYPISPGSALARILVPIYNIWGFWNVFSTMATYLSEKIRFWLPWLFILPIASRVFEGEVLRGESAPPALFLVSALINVALFCVWLRLAILIRSSLNEKMEGFPPEKLPEELVTDE